MGFDLTAHIKFMIALFCVIKIFLILSGEVKYYKTCNRVTIEFSLVL